MTNIIRESDVTAVVVDATERVVVTEDRPVVVTVGIQGPPGPVGPQGPTGALALPVGGEGGVLFQQTSTATVDAAHFSYDISTRALTVTTITNATLDGGNF